MTKNVAIFLCNKSGTMARPWADAGYECFCVDIQHSIRNDAVKPHGKGLIRFVWGDVRSWFPPASTHGRIAFMFAETPCTHLSSSGARDHQKKGGWMLADALQLFDSARMACVYSGAPYGLENPVGRLSTHRPKPDHYFQPWQYGDTWTKKTCLWTGNGFVMPTPTHTTPPEGTTEKIWLMAPSDDRADLRSETAPGFALAVFKANSHLTP